MAETQRRWTVMALSRIDDLTHADRFPDEVVDRIRVGYESQLSRIDRRLLALSSGGGAGGSAEDGPGDGPDGSRAVPDTNGHLRAGRELHRLVIATERTELDRLVTRRKVTERVAGGVRAALDVDETTMRP